VLPQRGAYPIGRRAVVNDIERLERLATEIGTVGHFVLLTNDRNYWSPPSGAKANVDAAFQLHEGRDLSGAPAWDPRASAGTIAGQPQPAELRGVYRLQWQPYSSLGQRNGQDFRYLLVEVIPRSVE
jgi:hypothetical protein